MATISTHILDTSVGRPAAGVVVILDLVGNAGSERIGQGTTDNDGRLRDLPVVAAGLYELRFATAPYFAASGRQSFFPDVTIRFEVGDEGQHYHVPLLLSPFGYSTYRGS